MSRRCTLYGSNGNGMAEAGWLILSFSIQNIFF
jgi:hypothetical protein